jgi:F-type H+-transporting ATPase subunit delta
MARPVAGARRFAEAAFQVALRDGTQDRWRDDLRIAAEVLGHEQVVPIVDSPAVALADRKGLVDRLLGKSVQPGVVRLVHLLVERGRIEVLPRVADEFVRLLNDHRGVVMAVVTSAAPLTPDEESAIRQRVETMAGAAVELRTEVDPSLIGGLTVQVRDRLLDASVRGRLERLRDQLHAGGTLR